MVRGGVWGSVALLVVLGCAGDEQPSSAGTTGGLTPAPSSSGTGSSGGPSTGSGTELTSSSSTSSSLGDSSSGGASTSAGSSSSEATGEPSRCPATSECFFIDGDFHTATEEVPTFEMDLAFEGDEFSALEVELDVAMGPWHPIEPDGLHNIFWLHRGPGGVGPWMGGVAGYVNLRGPGRNLIRTRHDLDVTDLADSRTFNVNDVVIAEGDQLHVLYRYDPVVGEAFVEISRDDGTVWSGTDTPTTDLIRNNIQNTFYFYAGNETDISLEGPEVPSLGWTYSNLRVEFMQ